MKKGIALVVVFFVFWGCASIVPQLDQWRVDSIHKGILKSQVFELLGMPDKAYETENGDVIWSYLYVTTPQATAGSPVKGASSVSANTQPQSLAIIFGRDEIVKNIMRGHVDAETNTKGSPCEKVDMLSTRRTGTSYSMADMAGTWELDKLASGPSAHGWESGTVNISQDGTFTASFIQNNVRPDRGTLSISTDGVITLQGNPNALFQMCTNKTIMLGASTWKEHQAGSAYLPILVKKAASYSIADLVGTWEINALDSPGPSWGRRTLTVDSGGSFSVASSRLNGANIVISGTFGISNDGIINASGSGVPSSFRCTMDLGKRVLVCTYTDFAGSADMLTLTKK
jgi:outer membrane protein assembly factor BamE (lipoprotein component of BamABCDE complex)